MDQEGSRAALAGLARGEAHVAGCHLLDEATGQYNEPWVGRLVPFPCQLVGFAVWEQGLIVTRQPARRARRRRSRAARRSAWSTAKRGPARASCSTWRWRALPFRRARSAATTASPRPPRRGRGRRAGLADVGVGVRAAAIADGLDFIPLGEERYDLVVPRHFLDLPAWRRCSTRCAGRPSASRWRAWAATTWRPWDCPPRRRERRIGFSRAPGRRRSTAATGPRRRCAPACRAMPRVAMACASMGSCVTSTVVVRAAASRGGSSASSAWRWGSPGRRTARRAAIVPARARARGPGSSRRASPPDSVRAARSARWAMPSRSSQSPTRSRCAAPRRHAPQPQARRHVAHTWRRTAGAPGTRPPSAAARAPGLRARRRPRRRSAPRPVGRQQQRHHLQQRALARAVRPHHDAALPAARRERRHVQNRSPAAPHLHVAQGDEGAPLNRSRAPAPRRHSGRSRCWIAR